MTGGGDEFGEKLKIKETQSQSVREKHIQLSPLDLIAILISTGFNRGTNLKSDNLVLQYNIGAFGLEKSRFDGWSVLSLKSLMKL